MATNKPVAGKARPRVSYTPELRDKIDRILDNQDRMAERQTKLEITLTTLATKLEGIERRVGDVEIANTKRSEHGWDRTLFFIGVAVPTILSIISLVR